MSVIDVHPDWHGRGGAATAGSGNDQQYQDYTAVFLVETDDKRDGAAVVQAALGVPRRGDIYNFGNDVDFNARCNKVTPTQDSNSPYVWRVAAEYSTKTPADDGQQNPNPLERPAKISVKSGLFERPFVKDIHGNPVWTRARERFEGLVVEDARIIVVVQKNLAVYPDALFTYVNKVNEDPWFNKDAETWKCQGLESDSEFENGIFFFPSAMEFHWREEGWHIQPVHEGFMELDDDDKQVLMKDKDGQYLSKPHPLDPDGKKLPVGGTPDYIDFEGYHKISYGSLGII